MWGPAGAVVCQRRGPVSCPGKRLDWEEKKTGNFRLLLWPDLAVLISILRCSLFSVVVCFFDSWKPDKNTWLQFWKHPSVASPGAAITTKGPENFRDALFSLTHWLWALLCTYSCQINQRQSWVPLVIHSHVAVFCTGCNLKQPHHSPPPPHMYIVICHFKALFLYLIENVSTVLYTYMSALVAQFAPPKKGFGVIYHPMWQGKNSPQCFSKSLRLSDIHCCLLNIYSQLFLSLWGVGTESQAFFPILVKVC